MKKLRKMITDKIAKSKKNIWGLLIALVVGSVIAIFVFGSAGSAWGIILGAAVFIVIALGVYFILKAIGDEPEALS
ncbi:MAG: hypothetical protein FK732_04500 [Asgard group archaeon]|nr:hypothetical protein [Asgard group archaeon]